MKLSQPLLGRAVIAGWLTTMWVLLWGELTLANGVSGVVLGVGLVLAFAPAATNDDPIVVRPWAALSFVIWFLWALIVTNVLVAREVVLPSGRSQIRTAVVSVPLKTRSGRLATIIANAISLTPGTLTVDARGRPAILYVHVLSFEDVETTRAEVADLERRVLRAFGTAEEVELISAPPSAAEGAPAVRTGDGAP